MYDAYIGVDKKKNRIKVDIMKQFDIMRIYFILILTLGLVFLLGRSLVEDELEALHTAWEIVQGGEIYQDFFQHYHPFLYYLLTPIIMVFGETIKTIITCRLVALLTGVGICYFTYKLAFCTYEDEQMAMGSLILLIFLCPFLMFGFQIRPDNPMVFFKVMTTYYLFHFLHT